MVWVCAGSLGGWDDDAGSLSRSDTGFVSLSPCVVPSGTVSGSWYTLRVVTGGFPPYFRRYSYRRASHRTRCLFACADSHALRPGVGVHLSRTSTSSPSGLRYEGVALSLMTSEPLFSFSTHRRTVLARTTCPISFTTRCSSDQPTLIEMFVVFLSQTREILQVFDLVLSNTPPSRTTEESEMCMDFL